MLGLLAGILILAVVLLVIGGLIVFELWRVACWAREVTLSADNQKNMRNEAAMPRTIVPGIALLAKPLFDIAAKARTLQAFDSGQSLSIDQIERVMAKAREFDGSDGDDQHAICERILATIHQQFKSLACALVYFVPSRNSFEVHSIGIAQARFEAHLRQCLTGYLEQGSEEFIGLRDGLDARSLLGDFTLFGFRYSLALPVLRGKSRHSRAVLWLGYGEERAPSEHEISLAGEVAQRVGRELAALSQVARLSLDVEQAEQRDKEKSDFIAHMSHDIRSPLHNIKAILSLLRSEDTFQTSSDLIDVALRNCQGMGEIVEDLLDYSRSRVGRLDSNPKAFDLNRLISDVVDEFSVSARLKGLALIYEKVPDAHFVEADQRQVRRILSNLISNAIKYTESGVVDIRIIERGLAWGIAVKDTGSGLSQKQLEQLFVAFSRFHRDVEGVGLGLTVSKILAELNRGSISVTSDKGSGSTFELSLPRAVGIVSLQQPAQVSLLLAQPALHILLVDDDADCTASLSRTIEAWGHHVTRAHSVVEALGLCNFGQPDLIISDASMPNGGGEKIVEYVRNTLPNAQVAVLSGNADSESWMHGLTHFVKPIDLDALRAWILEVSIVVSDKARAS